MVAKAIDEEFHSVARPTKTESEHAFQLGWIAMMGNVKAFILSICLAVVFAILLVSANTMAMSIRERTREVAVLKTLGFTQGSVLGLFVGEAVIVALVGGLVGILAAAGLIRAAGGASPVWKFFSPGINVTGATVAVALLVAATSDLLARSCRPITRRAKTSWMVCATSARRETSMAIPISYNIRNLKLRKGATIMTALGIALTVTTAIFMMALLAGLNAAFVTSGDPRNVLVLRKGSKAELAAGGVDRDAMPTHPRAARHCA